MKSILTFSLVGAVCLASPLAAQEALQPLIRDGVSNYIMPRVDAFAAGTTELSEVVAAECGHNDRAVEASFHNTFDAWTAMSHLRFGPTETDERAFAIAFWPDSRGVTPKVLRAMIVSDDPAISDPQAFRDVSIAGRGIYALEFLLFDPEISGLGSVETRCALARAIAGDMEQNAAGIAADWHNGFAVLLTRPGAGGRYETQAEAAQELFKALGAGLQFTAETRLGRPLGKVGKPRPKRAEAWRSGRSLHQVVLTLEAAQDLALRLASDNPDLQATLKTAFARALQAAQRVEDPVFAGVTTVQGRLRIEVLQQRISEIRTLIAAELGPKLGVAAGFNSLDGD